MDGMEALSAFERGIVPQLSQVLQYVSLRSFQGRLLLSAGRDAGIGPD
jgi:hypothetical protein